MGNQEKVNIIGEKINNEMIVYEFLYCFCTEESAWATQSIHRTPEGAERALNEHKEKRRKEWLQMREKFAEVFDDHTVGFGRFEDWKVRKTKVIE